LEVYWTQITNFFCSSSDSNESEINREGTREDSDEHGAMNVNARSEPNNHGDNNRNDNQAEHNASSNGQRAETPNERDNDNRNEMNIFDRFMDTILGANRNRVSPPMTIPIISGAGDNGSTVASATTDTSNTGDEVDSRTDSSNTNALSTSADSSGGAIIITVNYVFSDENNPQNPNRSGSLVMTLPNNSSNRDPRIIQEFIRLATQMAYSTIVNLNKEKGITIDKFNSFDIKTLEELKDTRECSICFEEYIAFSNNNDKKRSIVEGSKSHEDTLVKKRKLNNNDSDSTTNTSSASSASSTSYTLPTSANSTEASSASDQNESRPKYLSEFTGTFEHLPVQMPCGHIFGKSCLFEWLKNHSSCPLCRDSVSESNTNEASSTEVNGNMQNNPNITMMHGVHRPLFSDIFNSFSRERDDSTPVRRILRSGNGLGENNSPHTHIHTHSFSPQRLDSQDVAQEGESRAQNGVFSHLLNYLRRTQLNENSEPLFPTGVSSRRTNSGVETRLTDRIGSEDNVLEFMNLRSLVDDNRNNNDMANDVEEDNNNSNSQNDNPDSSNTNNNTSNNDAEHEQA